MPAITESLTIVGFAWLDETGTLNWAMREDFDGVLPKDRPEGCSPVVIEIVPAEEWTVRKRNDDAVFGDITDKINQFSTDLEALQHALRVRGS